MTQTKNYRATRHKSWSVFWFSVPWVRANSLLCKSLKGIEKVSELLLVSTSNGFFILGIFSQVKLGRLFTYEQKIVTATCAIILNKCGGEKFRLRAQGAVSLIHSLALYQLYFSSRFYWWKLMNCLFNWEVKNIFILWRFNILSHFYR